MRQVIRKWFWAWEFDKEEQWLNDMAAQGKALVSARYITYEFEDCAPGEYIVRLEMLANMPNTEEGKAYISFVEETGAEYLGHVMKWVYFRKKTADGPFELHSDNKTRLKHLKGIIALLRPLAVVNVGLAGYNLCVGVGLASPMNVVCAMLSALVAVLLSVGMVKLNDKKLQLEKESQLFE